MAKDNTNRDTDGGRVAGGLLSGWRVDGAEGFGADGGEAATRSAFERKRAVPDLADAICRGLLLESYLRDGDTLEAVAVKIGMDAQFGAFAGLRLAADFRLLVACEIGLLAHVGVGHPQVWEPEVDGGILAGVLKAPDCPATPLTLVQAEVCCGIRDFDGEYAGPFAALRWTCAGVDGAA